MKNKNEKKDVVGCQSQGAEKENVQPITEILFLGKPTAVLPTVVLWQHPVSYMLR